MSPKVSVVLATYNRAQFLGKAIESVLAQTFTDWELIVINDGSTDNSRSIAEPYVSRDARVRYCDQVHQGLPRTRTRGVSLAKGEYLAFLDDDDIYFPNKLAEQVRYLDLRPEMAFVYSQVEMRDAKNTFLRVWPEKPSVAFLDLIRQCTIQPNAILIRKKCVEAMHSFDPTLPGSDDYDLWLRTAKVFPFSFLPGCVGTYRWHQGNISHNRRRRCANYIRIYKKLMRSGLHEAEGLQVQQSAIESTYWKASEAVKVHRYADAAFYFKEAIKFNWQIGLVIPWSRIQNPIYRFLRPYLAILYCAVRNLTYVKT